MFSSCKMWCTSKPCEKGMDWERRLRKYPARIQIRFIDTSTHTKDALSSSPSTLTRGITLCSKFPLRRTCWQQRNIRIRQPQKLIHKVKPKQLS